YVMIMPSGRYVINTQPGGLQSSYVTFYSFAVNLAARTVATTGHAFWNLCGDHAAFISPSDGKDYGIVGDCNGFRDIVRADVTGNVGTESQQLAANKVLFQDSTWSLGGHMSTVARGPNKDWAFWSSEKGNNSSLASWIPYENEIVAFNVLTGETRRL